MKTVEIIHCNDCPYLGSFCAKAGWYCEATIVTDGKNCTVNNYKFLEEKYSKWEELKKPPPWCPLRAEPILITLKT